MRVPFHGLQQRVTLYMAIGLAALFGVFAYVAIDSAIRSSSVILQERVTLAKLLAMNIDSLLAASGNLVAEAAEDASATGLSQSDITPIVDALALSLNGLTQLANGTSIGVFDTDYTLVAGHQINRLPLSAADLLSESFGSGYRVVHDDAGRTIIGFIRRIPAQGDSSGWLLASIRPGPSALSVSVGSQQDSAQYRVELIASGGEVVASSDPNERELTSRHSRILSGLVGDEEPRVVEHVRVETDTEPVNHVVAFAPLTDGSLGIVLEQPEDVVLALPNDLRRRILLISGIGLAIGLAIAWLTSRQVVRPLEVLTRNARAIAMGKLDQPVVPSGQDEIRRLGESFETMRSRLSASVNELESWGTELERRVQERTTELEARNLERDRLLNKVITAQEDERARVARDLHDQVGQSLTALVMQLGAAEALLAKEKSDGTIQVQSAREGLSGTIEEVRRLMSDLRPSVLDDMGLASAVRWYTEQRLVDIGIRTDIAVDPISRKLPPTTEISVFRIFQESINNIVKHAGAKRVSVVLRTVGDHLEGAISDDGMGFDSGTVVTGNNGRWAVGLIGMRERVHLLCGTIEIQSSPEAGTSVSFRIPIRSRAMS